MIFLEEGASNIMTTIIEAMGDAFSLVGKVVTEITGQPILLFFLAASLSLLVSGFSRGFAALLAEQQPTPPALRSVRPEDF
jgi:hypothetical protein